MSVWDVRGRLRGVAGCAPPRLYPEAREFLVTSSEAPYWRHTYEYRPEMEPALFEGKAASTRIYADAHGAWISAYAPLVDDGGRVVAILEVDAHQEQLLARVTSRVSEELEYTSADFVVTLVCIVLVV